jgi:pSer/pThr/pTyr-binding forkhead associated (FHA) protein
MAHSGTELPILTGQTGPLSGQRWQIDTELIIGRDPGCDVVINDRQVSRYHARIERNLDGVQVEDLGSKNGTFVNGLRIEEPAALHDNDMLQIALVQHFLFLLSDATMPLDTQALPSTSLASAAVTPPSQRERLYLEPRSRRIWVKGQEIVPPLSLQQFRLLEALQRRKGQVVTRQELIDEIWGEDEALGVSEQAFDALVRRLRERLSQLDPDHSYVVTVRGHGLRMEDQD